ncbi:MAG: hypothetical protein MZV65_17835 [Chromatiales bacterium]|nr:hypothetical protein [Chromatiales bacterium]
MPPHATGSRRGQVIRGHGLAGRRAAGRRRAAAALREPADPARGSGGAPATMRRLAAITCVTAEALLEQPALPAAAGAGDLRGDPVSRRSSGTQSGCPLLAVLQLLPLAGAASGVSAARAAGGRAARPRASRRPSCCWPSTSTAGSTPAWPAFQFAERIDLLDRRLPRRVPMASSVLFVLLGALIALPALLLRRGARPGIRRPARCA